MKNLLLGLAVIAVFNFTTVTIEEIKEEIHNEYFFSDDDHIDHFFD